MDNNNEVQLIKIEAVVREEMFLDVKKALMDIGCLLYTSPSPRDRG